MTIFVMRGRPKASYQRKSSRLMTMLIERVRKAMLRLLHKSLLMDYEFSFPFTVTNILAIATAIMAMRWPTLARILLGTIFIGAAFVNTYTALANPQVYITYGELTPSEVYRSIILGPFSQHPQRYVLIIAACQLFIGAATWYKGQIMRVGMIGAILFLLAIAPLGMGSAFPSTLIMATAFGILLTKKIDFNIYEVVEKRFKYSRQ